MSLEPPVRGSLEVVLAEISALILKQEPFDYWIPRRLSWGSIPIPEGVYPGRRPSPTRALPWAVVFRPVGAGGSCSGAAGGIGMVCLRTRSR